MPTNPTTQNPRGYGDVRQNDVNMTNAVNAIKNEISRDVQAVSANGGGNNGGGGATATTVNVPANRAEWTPTGVSLSGADALAIAATGTVAFNSNPDAVFSDVYNTPLTLEFVVMPVGVAPNGDEPARFAFTAQNTISGVAGEVHARWRDVGGSGDNQGGADLTLVYFADAKTAFRLLAQKIRQSEVVGLADALAARATVTALAAEIAARGNADAQLQNNLDAKNDSNIFALDAFNGNAPSLIRNVFASAKTFIVNGLATKLNRDGTGLSSAEKSAFKTNMEIIAGGASVSYARARLAGGANFFGVPGVDTGSIGTVVASGSTYLYEPFIAPSPWTFDQFAVEITGAAAAGRSSAIALYSADMDFQPISRLVDGGEFLADTVAVKTITVNPGTLPAGRYVKILSSPSTTSYRGYRGGQNLVGVPTTMGTALITSLRATVGYTGVFPATNATQFDTITTSTTPFSHIILMRYSYV